MQQKVYTEMEDSQVWLHYTLGEEQALAHLYCKYYNYLYSYGLKLHPHEELIQDSIQDLFLRLWENRKKMGPVTYVKAYFLQALRKNLLTRLGRVKRQHFLRKSVFLSEPTISFSIEDLLIREEKTAIQSKQIVAALNKLTSRQREAVYLRCYENLSYEEIAMVMSINYQSVVNHVHEAFKTLKSNELLQALIRLSFMLLSSGLSF